MKITFILAVAALSLFITSHRAAAGILSGPISNPVTRHDYYLLTPNTWSASEVEAEQLGGTLAVIRNSAEQEWVFSKFGAFGGTNRSLWLGRYKHWPGGPFLSVTDERVDYFNWDPGEPNNTGGGENFIQMLTNGKWNDNIDTGNPVCGVVEVPGKSNEPALTDKEKSLLGSWYNNGDPDQPCYLAGTDKLLFAIDQYRGTTRVIDTPEGFLFSPGWKQYAILTEDKILWSRGNWWSRKPVKFKMLAAPSINTNTKDNSGGSAK